jgi:chromate reductase
MSKYKIAVIVGSLRKESFNRKMALALADLAPASLQLEIVEIDQLQMYNQDLDEGTPPREWTEFRQKLKSFQAVVFITPEYNRSVPAVLKNAIDVGSRPYGESVWDKKPAAIVSVSPGATGGFGANHHLRQSLVFLNMPTLQQPEAYIGGAGELFGEKGEIVKESTRKYMQKFITVFAEWVERTVMGVA